MVTRPTRTVLLAVVLAGLLLLPSSAHAYGGPGGVITGLGALLALVAAVLAAIFGFLWYPLKRLARWIHALRVGEDGEPDAGSHVERRR